METHQRHVAVCAFPFGTHAPPLLLLVKQLAAASPETRFSFFNTETSNASLFKEIDGSAYSNIVPCSIMPERLGRLEGNPMKAIEMFIELAPESFRRRMEEVEEEVGVKIVCVIGDAFLWFCGEIAEEKGLCWIPLWTANAVSLSAHFHTDVLRTKFGVLEQGTEDREDELIDCVPGFLDIHISDLPMGIVDGDLNSPFNQLLYKMGLMLPKANGVAINSFEQLSPIITDDLKSKMKLLCVGPFTLTSPTQVDSDQHNCLPWLDKQKGKSVAYISFGTVTMPPSHEIVALAEALEASGVPFLWSMNETNKACLPSSFVDRINKDEALGKIVPWAPQMKLLAHPSIGVFITHCGWNSIMESIVNGVPLICRPMLGDQRLNWRFVECILKFGVGLEGGAFTKCGTINALHHVLSSNEGEQMRKNVQVLKQLAEESIKPGGSTVENLNALIELVTKSGKT